MKRWVSASGGIATGPGLRRCENSGSCCACCAKAGAAMPVATPATNVLREIIGSLRPGVIALSLTIFQRHAAIHHKLDAGDVAALVAGEIDRRPGDVPGLSTEPHGHLPGT